MIFKEILDSIKHIALAVIIALIITRYIGQTAIVNQYSMQKTLYQNDVLWIEKITPLLGKLRRGDIVTVYAPVQLPTNEGHTLIKRIAAIPGDYIEIKNGKVFVNGAALKEPYIKGDYTTEPENPKYNSLIVPTGKYYVLGDNRYDSIIDSRSMGLVDANDIKARAIFRFFPLKSMGSLVRK
jgi:signal peptidase I